MCVCVYKICFYFPPNPPHNWGPSTTLKGEGRRPALMLVTSLLSAVRVIMGKIMDGDCESLNF